jgi:hypothetical protein
MLCTIPANRPALTLPLGQRVFNKCQAELSEHLAVQEEDREGWYIIEAGHRITWSELHEVLSESLESARRNMEYERRLAREGN